MFSAFNVITNPFTRFVLVSSSISTGFFTGIAIAKSCHSTVQHIYHFAKCVFTSKEHAILKKAVVHNHPFFEVGARAVVIKTTPCDSLLDRVVIGSVSSAVAFAVMTTAAAILFIAIPKALGFSLLSQKLLLLAGKVSIVSSSLTPLLKEFKSYLWTPSSPQEQVGIILRKATQEDNFPDLLPPNHPPTTLYSRRNYHFIITTYETPVFMNA